MTRNKLQNNTNQPPLHIPGDEIAIPNYTPAKDLQLGQNVTFKPYLGHHHWAPTCQGTITAIINWDLNTRQGIQINLKDNNGHTYTRWQQDGIFCPTTTAT
jgi:hypothetical protein